MSTKKWWVPIALIVFIAIIFVLVALIPADGHAEKAKKVKTYGSLKDDSGDYDLDYDRSLVKEIQRALNSYLSKHAKKYRKLDVDGGYGPGTANAVKKFQHLKGMTPDGVCGPRTLKALGIDTKGVKVYPRWVPNLQQEFDKRSTNGLAMHLNLGSRRLEVYRKIDGEWKLIRCMRCAIGDLDDGTFTPLVATTLSGAGHPTIYGTNSKGQKWAADDATEFRSGFYFHSVLKWKKNGKWKFDDNSCLGKACSHGCVRLSRENAKWIKENCKSGTACVIDDRTWKHNITD